MRNQTAYLRETGKFEIENTPMPQCGPEDVVVQIKHMGICGSDVMFYQDPTVGGIFKPKFPMVLGHECAGVVTEVGVRVENFAIGDKVALEPGVPCCKCEYCLSGKYNLCQKVNFMAAPPFLSGALHRFVAHPAAFTFKLPDNVSTLEGAMIEPLAVGIHAANRAQAEPGKSIVILGTGCIGLMTLLACRSRGASNITVIDLFENRLNMAKELGAAHGINAEKENSTAHVMELTNGMGADIVFETAGSVHTAKQTPELVKAGGKVVMVGNIHGNTSYDFFTMNCKEADIISVFRYCNVYPSAIESVASGNIPVKKIASNFFAFNQVNEAFACALNEKQTALKVVMEF
ncbi:MAG: NAD(P)-dependent alcohol dehydrogenase [Ruthenibacterium sp.]